MQDKIEYIESKKKKKNKIKKVIIEKKFQVELSLLWLFC